MSNAIVQVLEDAAQKIARAVEDAAKSVGHFFEDTGQRLEQAAKSHLEHDSKAASDLEQAARHGDETPTIHGGGDAPTVPASAGGSSPDVGADLDRVDKLSHDIQTGYQAKSTDPLTRDQFPPGYQPMQGETIEQYLAKHSDGTFNKYGDPNWNYREEAPNNGALPGTEHDMQIQPGGVIDRYGEPHGKYLSPAGTSYPGRGLPADNLAKGYYQYRVVRPLPAHQGVVAPAFGEPGGGVQYRLDESVQWYLEHGYLEKINT